MVTISRIRLTCSLIRRISCRTGSASGPSTSLSTSRLPWITATGLLTSWATPAVSCPIAASFSDITSRRWASRKCRLACSNAWVRSSTLVSNSSAQHFSSWLRCCSRFNNSSKCSASLPISSLSVTWPIRASRRPASISLMVWSIRSRGRKMVRAHFSDRTLTIRLTMANSATITASVVCFAFLKGASRNPA
ncbi:hypothetical protein D9M69_489090 [compost metagenome]